MTATVEPRSARHRRPGRGTTERRPAAIDRVVTADPPGAAQPTGPTQARAELASVARGGMVTMLATIVSAVANLVLVVVVTHGMSRTRAGEFFALTSVFLVAETLCRLGADTSLVYFVARWRALGVRQLIRPGLRTAVVPTVVVAVIVAVLLAVFAPAVVDVAVKGGASASAVPLLRVLAVLLPAAVLYDLVIGATRGFGRMRPTATVDKIARPVLQLALVSAVLAIGWRAGIGLAWATPYLVCVVAAGWMLVRIGLPDRAPRRRGEIQQVVRAEFWRFTTPRAAAGVAQVLMQRLDIVLVAALAGPSPAAIYTAATRFLVVGQFVNQAVTAPVQPRLSALLAAGDRTGARTLFRVSTTWLVLLSWPVFGASIALAPTYLAAFGHGYRDAVDVVVILSVSMLVASACGLVDSVVIMAGRTSWNLATTLLALAVNVIVDLLLIPGHGILGAAIGWCAAILVSNVVPLLLAWRGLRLHPMGRSLALAVLVCGVCFLALPIAAVTLTHSQIAAVAALAVGAVLFVAFAWRERAVFELSGILGRREAAAP